MPKIFAASICHFLGAFLFAMQQQERCMLTAAADFIVPIAWLVIILASVSKSCHDNCSSRNREYNKITKNNFCRLLDVFADELNYTAKVGCAVLSKMLVQMWMLSTFMLTKLTLSILCLSLLLSRLRGQMWSHQLLQFQRRKFQKHDYKIDQPIEFSQSTTYWVGEVDNNELHWCLVNINPYT